MTRQHPKRRTTASFLALPHHLIESDEFAALSPYAVKLLVNLASQYRGNNNGDLAATWTIMSRRGWKSKGTLYKAIHELVGAGFIVVTARHGRLSKKPTLYAITWQSVDKAEGSGDIAAGNAKPNLWQKKSRYISRTGRAEYGTPRVPLAVVK